MNKLTSAELNKILFGTGSGAKWALISFALMITLFSMASPCMSPMIVHKLLLGGIALLIRLPPATNASDNERQRKSHHGLQKIAEGHVLETAKQHIKAGEKNNAQRHAVASLVIQPEHNRKLAS
jgi:hypothetical protein